jgi:hypothetical protein
MQSDLGVMRELPHDSPPSWVCSLKKSCNGISWRFVFSLRFFLHPVIDRIAAHILGGLPIGSLSAASRAVALTAQTQPLHRFLNLSPIGCSGTVSGALLLKARLYHLSLSSRNCCAVANWVQNCIVLDSLLKTLRNPNKQPT